MIIFVNSSYTVHVTEQRLDDIDASSSDEEGGHESPERVKKTGDIF